MWTQKPSTTTKPPTFLQFVDLSAWFLMLSVVCYYLTWIRNKISIQLAVTWNHTISIEQGKHCAWLDCWQVEPEKAHNGRSQQGGSSRRVLVIASRDVMMCGFKVVRWFRQLSTYETNISISVDSLIFIVKVRGGMWRWHRCSTDREAKNRSEPRIRSWRSRVKKSTSRCWNSWSRSLTLG